MRFCWVVVLLCACGDDMRDPPDTSVDAADASVADTGSDVMDAADAMMDVPVDVVEDVPPDVPRVPATRLHVFRSAPPVQSFQAVDESGTGRFITMGSSFGDAWVVEGDQRFTLDLETQTLFGPEPLLTVTDAPIAADAIGTFAEDGAPSLVVFIGDQLRIYRDFMDRFDDPIPTLSDFGPVSLTSQGFLDTAAPFVFAKQPADPNVYLYDTMSELTVAADYQRRPGLPMCDDPDETPEIDMVLGLAAQAFFIRRSPEPPSLAYPVQPERFCLNASVELRESDGTPIDADFAFAHVDSDFTPLFIVGDIPE